MKIVSNPTYCISGENFLIDLQNYGGISKGLAINISFECNLDDKIEIKNPIIILPVSKDDLNMQRLPLDMVQSVANGKRVYSANIPDFSIPEGVNIYSTKLSGKKKQDEIDMRSFGLLFVPKGSKEILRSMVVEIIPFAYPVNKAVLKAYGLKE